MKQNKGKMDIMMKFSVILFSLSFLYSGVAFTKPPAKAKEPSIDELYTSLRKGCYKNASIEGKDKKAMTAICNCIERMMRQDRVDKSAVKFLLLQYTDAPEFATEQFKSENEPTMDYDEAVTMKCLENPNR